MGSEMCIRDSSYPCAIMGCDAPHIVGSDLVKAHEKLLLGQNVLGPSNDGGYYFIGLTQPSNALFHDMVWGNEAVLAATLERAKKDNIAFVFLEPLDDVDEWQDLLSVATILPSLANVIDA